MNSFQELLSKAYAEAKLAYPNILEIWEYEHDPQIDCYELVRKHVGPDMRQIQFDSASDVSKIGASPFTTFLISPDGRELAAIFISISPLRNRETNAGINLLWFFHELGHVDDFSKKVNLVPGKKVDLVAAELYAHQFACEQMFQRNLHCQLALYLFEIDTQSNSTIAQVAESAKALSRSPEYPKWRQAVAPLM